MYKCADCGVATSSMGPQALCWCGFSHKLNTSTAYSCVSFSILNERPELRQAFLECGCDPGRGEVGIILADRGRL